MMKKLKKYAMKKWKLKRIMAALVCLFCVFRFPFILDQLYGKGRLEKYFDNSFSAEAWFSFIGSYFPATVMGVLTLYQASIIKEQERQYKKLLNCHRFIPDGHVFVYRFDRDNHANNHYNFNEIRQILTRSGREELQKEWENGYIIKSDIYIASDIKMEKAEVKKIEWEINGCRYEQHNSKRMAVIINRITHSKQQIIIYWKFNETQKAGEDIAKCMLNETRHDIRYETSNLHISMRIVDEGEETCDLKMRCCLQASTDNYQMASIEETCYVE